MTDEQKALVERLRNYGDCLDYQIHEDRNEAADLIEAQAAENARLREALGRIARLESVGGPDAELQCADMASAALAQETKP